MKKVLTTPELKTFWNKFTISYLKTSSGMNNLFNVMCNVTILEKGKNKIDNVLEMACGSGKGLCHLLDLFKDQCVNLYGTDISENMLDIAFYNLSQKKNINLEYKTHKIYSKENKHNVYLSECNNENMNTFPDKHFDIILSNNSLHLVADANKMLQEANRLLKDNGTACFSIWGRPENSFVFTLIPNTLKKLNVPLPNLRSNFYLSKKSLLIPLLKNNGFDKINICHTFLPFPIFKPEDFYHYFDAPVYSEILERMDEKTKETLYKDIDRELEIKLGNNEFIGAEFILIRCAKF